MAEKNNNPSEIEEIETSDQRTVNIGRAPDFGIMYSDGVRMSISAYDIKLTFVVNESLPNNDTLITELITVVLSPQHAKELATTLTKNVEKYENEVMSLQFNEDYQKKLNEKKLLVKKE